MESLYRFPQNPCGVSGRAYIPKLWAFGDMPHAQTGETPYIQRHHSGTAIAPQIAPTQIRYGDDYIAKPDGTHAIRDHSVSHPAFLRTIDLQRAFDRMRHSPFAAFESYRFAQVPLYIDAFYFFAVVASAIQVLFQSAPANISLSLARNRS